MSFLRTSFLRRALPRHPLPLALLRHPLSRSALSPFSTFSATRSSTQETPAQDTPVQDSLVQDTPAQDTPAQDTPAQDTPAQNTLAQDTLVQDTPAQDTLVQDTPAQDTPAQDTLVQDTLVQDTPAQDTPAQNPSQKEPSVRKPRPRNTQYNANLSFTNYRQLHPGGGVNKVILVGSVISDLQVIEHEDRRTMVKFDLRTSEPNIDTKGNKVAHFYRHSITSLNQKVNLALIHRVKRGSAINVSGPLRYRPMKEGELITGWQAFIQLYTFNLLGNGLNAGTLSNGQRGANARKFTPRNTNTPTNAQEDAPKDVNPANADDEHEELSGSNQDNKA